jgi:CHAT domain-containing protein
LADLSRPLQFGWILAPDEALIVYMQTTDSLFAVLISRTQAQLIRLDAQVKTISRLVEKVRRSTQFASDGRLPPFDLAAAQELQERIWKPVKEAMGPTVKVTIVTEGPLASIPFELLPVGQSGAIGKARWLDDDVDIRYVPSVSSMTALQKVQQPADRQLRRAAIVFGPPSLPTPMAGAKPTQGSFSAYLSSARMGDELSPAVLCEGKLSAFPPSVTGMARDLAESFGATPDDTFVHERMVKSQLQRLNAAGLLSRYANLAFVTHGLVAGQLVGNANTEPALVFSPTVGCQDPNIASTALLTASEVAELKLDADWVMLLACDTASADGTPGAEPLSGLARAFMFAGARALLISHWSVNAHATSKLMQHFAQDRRTAGRSNLLRQARTQLRADANFAHPAYWAGFSIVGVD